MERAGLNDFIIFSNWHHTKMLLYHYKLVSIWDGAYTIYNFPNY